MVDWFTRTTGATKDATGASHDVWVECNAPVGDLSQVRTPVYVYHGRLDETVPIAMAENHVRSYPHVMAFRVDETSAHLASIRRLGQTLLDIANPYFPARLICHLSESNSPRSQLREQPVGRIEVVSEARADQLISQGKAINDICAWVGTPGE